MSKNPFPEIKDTDHPASETTELLHGNKKPCRSCVDFKTWMKQTNKDVKASQLKDEPKKLPHDCPLDKDELGRNTWSFLHTMAANYPELPTENQQKQMTSFMSTFSNFYPCSYCAHDFRISIRKQPVEAESQERLSQWMCRMHNGVNQKLGKPLFDCSKVNERWRDGWKDGSCG